MQDLSDGHAEIVDSGIFAVDWYLAEYPDVAAAGMDPIEHYLRHGAEEGRDPGPMFSTFGYRQRYPDVAFSGVNPLLHYLRCGRAEGRRTGPFTSLRRPQRDYRNLSEYLRQSLLYPLVEAPFTAEDHGCFAVMENIAVRLCAKLKAASQFPLVSIIMPMRDRDGVVGAAVQSVLAQTYPNFELIVVDDGSEDNSAAVVRSFSDARLHLIEHGSPQGVAAARNKGLAAATGALIAYLDSDNTWRCDYLTAMVGAFHILPDADALYCGQYLYQGKAGKPSAVRFGVYNHSLLRNRNYIDLNCFMHRQAVVNRIGDGFCEQMQRLVDWEFILRISSVGRIYAVPIIMSNYCIDKADNTITATQDIEPARSRLMALGEFGYRKINPDSPAVSRKVTIVVAGHNTLDSLATCIEPLAGIAANPLVQIIIVDNTAGAEVIEFLRGLEDLPLTFMVNDRDDGVFHALNQGVSRADPDSDILVLHPDAVLTEGALGRLQTAACEDELIAVAAPQLVLSGGEDTINNHVPYACSDFPCDVTLSAYHGNVEPLPLFYGGGPLELNFASFGCVYIKRQAWELCGGLDVRPGRHFRSDRSMCDFIREVLGMRIVYVPSAVVFQRRQAVE